MNYGEKLFKGSAVVFGAAAIAAAISYLLRLFLARNLSVADFGLLYSILAFVGLFAIFKDIGLGSTLVKFLAEFAGSDKKEHIKSSITAVGAIQILSAFIFMVPIIVFSDVIAISYLKTPDAAFPLQLIAVSFIIGTVMTLLQHAAQGLGHATIYAIVEPIRIAVTFAASIAMIYIGVTGVSYAYVLAAAVTVAFLFISLRSKGTITGKAIPEKKLVKDIMKFALPVFIGGLSALLLFYTDTIIITIFRGVEEVGLYNAALPTSQLLWIIVTALVAVLLPVISEMWAKKQTEHISNALSLIAKFSFVVLIPLAMMMVAFAEDVIRLLFGEAYIAAATALQILSINAIFYTVFVIFSTSLISVNKPLTNTKITAVISVINLVMNVALVPQYGIAAAAFATTISYLIGATLTYFALKKTITITLDMKSLAKIAAGGLISLAAIFIIKTLLVSGIWPKVALSLVISLGIYFFFVLYTKGVTKKELEYLKKLNLPVPKFVSRTVERLSS